MPRELAPTAEALTGYRPGGGVTTHTEGGRLPRTRRAVRALRFSNATGDPNRAIRSEHRYLESRLPVLVKVQAPSQAVCRRGDCGWTFGKQLAVRIVSLKYIQMLSSNNSTSGNLF